MARYNRAYVYGIVPAQPGTISAYGGTAGTPRGFLVLLEEEVENNGVQQFRYKRFKVTEPELVNFCMKNKGLCVNFTTTVGGGIKTTHGDLSRYDLSRHKSVRIITGEIRNYYNKDELLGYRVVDESGNPKRKLLKDCIALGIRLRDSNEVPFANAQFVSQAGKKAFYRSYTSDGFPKEYLKIGRENEHAHEVKIDKKENEKAVKKLEDIFTPEQITELKKAKKAGVDIRIIGNSNLSAKQMEEIWKAEAEGLKGRRYADPAYKVENMEFMRTEMETGSSIDYMLNPKYTIEQLFELSRAYELGVDMNKVANPNIKATKMSQIIDDLSKEIWTDYKVIEGGSKLSI